MNLSQTTRRTILLLVTTLTGSILIFFDGDLLLVLGTTFIVGFTMLILLGLLDLSGFDPVAEARKFEATLPEGSLFRRINEKTDEPAPLGDSPPRKEKPARPRMFSSFSGKLRGYLSLVRSHRSTKKADAATSKDIDALLDETIHEPVSAGGMPSFEDFDLDLDEDAFGDEVDVEKRISEKIESLTTLNDDAFKKLESEINEKVFSEKADLGLEITLEEEDVPAFSGGAGIGMGGFGDGPAEDLSGFDDLAGFEFEGDELSLEDIDIEDVEPDPAGESPAEKTVDEPRISLAEVPSPPVTPASRPDPAEFGDDGDFASFGFENDGESDIMSLLRSDSRREKSVTDLSLVRDLRDVDVDAGELEQEMKDVLQILEKNTVRRKA